MEIVNLDIPNTINGTYTGNKTLQKLPGNDIMHPISRLTRSYLTNHILGEV